MAAIHDLLSQVQDEDLREKLLQEVKKLEKTKKFGLVFEEHIPECTPLYDIPIRKGSKVSLKTGSAGDFYYVVKVNERNATCLRRGETDTVEFPVSDLVSVAEFGEPIYPYLKPIDAVCNASDSDLWHTLIEADNYHALQLLEYLYAGKVDCIYIDPPYNTGAKDWKYNNDYVDNTDNYRHSKWLSMMQRRLLIAKKLLTKDGAMIIAIDDNEFSHLYMLLEEIMPEYKRTVISVQMNAKGTQGSAISVDNEYLIILYNEKTNIKRFPYDGEEKRSFRRVGSTSTRYEGATCFYPIIIDEQDRIIGFGDVLPDELHPTGQIEDNKDGTFNVWPIDSGNVERKWRYARGTVEEVMHRLSVRHNNRGIEIMFSRDSMPVRTMWYDVKYNSQSYGSDLLAAILGKNKFSYPKSLYAVKDALYPFVSDKKNAIVIDFFAGSGTTLHAVNLLNAEDGGNRRCIMVTNNEVSDAEAKDMIKHNIKPGDDEWEKLGIARHVTWPRTVCTIEGHDVNGNPLNGSYLGNDMPMAAGFKANAAFFKLGFLNKTAVALGMQFKEMLPVLWMKAGAYGPCPAIGDTPSDMLILPENRMAILFNENAFSLFADKINPMLEIETAFITTDYDINYRNMVSGLNGKTTYQLYRDYLDSFRINHGRN